MRKVGITILLALSVLAMSGCGAKADDVVAKESPLVEIDNDYTEMAEIYSGDFQNKIRNQVEELKKEDYTLQAPLVLANPYRTNTTGLYVYFQTEEPTQINYTVTADGYPDFARTLYNEGEDNLSDTHEYMLIGCVPQIENTVCLTAVNAKGESLGSYTFTYTPPALLNDVTAPVAEVTKGESSQPLADGLYNVLGNDSTEDEMDEDCIAMYDNDGILRCEIPIVSFRAHDLIFDDNGMYYSISAAQMACLDRTGAVNRVYHLGDYRLHHDYVFGTRGDMLILASRANGETKDDIIVSLDLDSGQVREIIDLGKLFPDYLAASTKPEGAEVLDWMHVNSIVLVGEDSIIISARETSSIIRIDHIYGEPEVNYMIGSDQFWAGSGYENLLLTRVGEFSLQGGQHSVVYVSDDSLEENQYYLVLYNNNNTYSLARKEYDWSVDDNYYDTGVAVESNGFPSYYYKYLVDEDARTFQLVDSIPVGYSGFVSCVQLAGENIVIDSGGCLTTYEFDKDGTLIQQLVFQGKKWIYRTKKYEFLDYWFVK